MLQVFFQAAILAGATVCGFASATLAQDFPISVNDDRGVTVVIDNPPAKVASLGMFGADMMKALGKKAIGTTTYNGRLPPYLDDGQGLVDFGIEPQPNIEVLTRTAPDLIIGIRRYTEPWAKSFEPIAPYIAYDLLTEEDSLRAVSSASMALGVGAQGAEMNAEYERQLSEYAQKAPGGVSAIFIWLFQDTPFAYYDHVMPATFFGHLNATNVMGQNPTPAMTENFGGPISYEDLLAMDPDVLFIFRAEGNAYPDTPALRRLRAVREGRAWHVGHQYSQPAGPVARMLILRETANLLYPDVFPAPDLGAGVKAEPLRFAR